MTRAFLRMLPAYLLAGLTLIALSHALPRFMPGDFVTAMYSGSHLVLNGEEDAELRRRYAHEEGCFQYLARLCRLDWGYSQAFMTPVSRLILDALPWTLLLMGTAHLISTALGFAAGVEAAWRRGQAAQKISVEVMTILEGVPEIATGVLLLLVFALKLGWSPAAGAETAYAQHGTWQRVLDVANHLVLPLSTLVVVYLPGNFLLARWSMLLVLKAPFMETARAKGLPPLRVRYAHGACNALLPLVTRLGLRIAFMVTGAVVVETIHSYPGLGTLLFNAIARRDIPLVQGIVLFSSITFLAVNMGLELFYGWLDPRLKHAS